MARQNSDSLFYLSLGPAAAILLGMALTPLRGLTPASNLSFAFMALTIVVAEFGGRWAAMGTALVSALSLDFFLTQPYLRLSIEDKQDVVAFVGLAACGLVAAALGSQRSGKAAALKALEARRDLVRVALRDWTGAAPPGPPLTRLLGASTDVFPLSAAVLRRADGAVIADSGSGDGARPIPQDVLQPDTLSAGTDSGGSALDWSLALPRRGGRIALAWGDRRVGWLDVWGDGRPADAETRRALTDVARLVTALLSSADPGSAPGAPLGA